MLQPQRLLNRGYRGLEVWSRGHLPLSPATIRALVAYSSQCIDYLQSFQRNSSLLWAVFTLQLFILDEQIYSNNLVVS